MNVAVFSLFGTKLTNQENIDPAKYSFHNFIPQTITLADS